MTGISHKDLKSFLFKIGVFNFLSPKIWLNDFQIIEGLFHLYKVGCVFPMVIVTILPHAEFGPNDHREKASHFTKSSSGSKL